MWCYCYVYLSKLHNHTHTHTYTHKRFSIRSIYEAHNLCVDVLEARFLSITHFIRSSHFAARIWSVFFVSVAWAFFSFSMYFNSIHWKKGCTHVHTYHVHARHIAQLSSIAFKQNKKYSGEWRRRTAERSDTPNKHNDDKMG